MFLSSQYFIDSLSFVDLVITIFTKLQIFTVAVCVGLPSWFQCILTSWMCTLHIFILRVLLLFQLDFCFIFFASLYKTQKRNNLDDMLDLNVVYTRKVSVLVVIYFNYNLQWWFLLEYWFLSFCNSSALFSMGLSYFWHDSRSNIWPFINMQSCFP